MLFSREKSFSLVLRLSFHNFFQALETRGEEAKLVLRLLVNL